MILVDPQRILGALISETRSPKPRYPANAVQNTISRAHNQVEVAAFNMSLLPHTLGEQFKRWDGQIFSGQTRTANAAAMGKPMSLPGQPVEEPSTASKAGISPSSFKRLVGESEQLVWNSEAERPRGLEVDD